MDTRDKVLGKLNSGMIYFSRPSKGPNDRGPTQSKFTPHDSRYKSLLRRNVRYTFWSSFSLQSSWILISLRRWNVNLAGPPLRQCIRNHHRVFRIPHHLTQLFLVQVWNNGFIYGNWLLILAFSMISCHTPPRQLIDFKVLVELDLRNYI